MPIACTINGELDIQPSAAKSHRPLFLHQSLLAPQGRRPATANQTGDNMAQTHYTSKTKRRPKNSARKDPSAATMAALRQLEAAAKK
jgi:hypothetical protein